MMDGLEAILGFSRPIKGYLRACFGWGWRGIFNSMFVIALCANRINMKHYHLVGCCSYFQFWAKFGRTCLDFIEGLPRSGGRDTILVVVDRLSKYRHFIVVKHPFTVASIAGIFVKEVVRLHRVPNSIVSNRDKNFVSHFWEELFQLQGTQLNRSSSYHP